MKFSSKSFFKNTGLSFQFLFYLVLCIVFVPFSHAESSWTCHVPGGGGGQTGFAVHPQNSDIVYCATDNGGVIKSTNGGELWYQITNNLGGKRIVDIEMDPLNPDVLYVSASTDWERENPKSGELYRTRNAGTSWEPVFSGDEEGVGGFSLTSWPNARHIVLAFDQSDSSRFDQDGDKLTDVIYIGGWGSIGGGIWKSTDEGKSFHRMGLNSAQVWALRQDPSNPMVLYAGTFNMGLYKSSNSGQQWTNLGNGFYGAASDIAVAADGKTIYVATSDVYGGACEGVFKSIDAGGHFSQINNADMATRTNKNVRVLGLDPRDQTGNTVFAATFGGSANTWAEVLKTTDGGNTWKIIPTQLIPEHRFFKWHHNWIALEPIENGGFYAANWAGNYKHIPSENLVEIKSEGLGNIGISALTLDPTDNTVFYMSMLDGNLFKFTHQGEQWKSIDDGFGPPYEAPQHMEGASCLAVSLTNPQVLYGTGVGGSGSAVSTLCKSTNGGTSWIKVVDGLPPPQTWVATSVVISPSNPDIAYVALDGSSVYKTSDGGKLWSKVFGEGGGCLAINRTEPHVVVGGATGILCIGRNGGTSWSSIDVQKVIQAAGMNNPGFVYAVDIFPTDPQRILIGCSWDGAYLTEDGGETWRQIFGPKQLEPFKAEKALTVHAASDLNYRPTFKVVKFDPSDSNTMYLGHDPLSGQWTGVGLLKTTDGGRTWESLMDDVFAFGSVGEMDIDSKGENFVVGGTEVYYYHGDVSSFIAHPSVPYVSKDVFLPHPYFNGQWIWSVGWRPPHAASVRVVKFDLHGREVGSFSVPHAAHNGFSGQRSRLSDRASSVGVYCLTLGSHVYSKRLLCCK